jgi:hypothetical protein
MPLRRPVADCVAPSPVRGGFCYTPSGERRILSGPVCICAGQRRAPRGKPDISRHSTRLSAPDGTGNAVRRVQRHTIRQSTPNGGFRYTRSAQWQILCRASAEWRIMRQDLRPVADHVPPARRPADSVPGFRRVADHVPPTRRLADPVPGFPRGGPTPSERVVPPRPATHRPAGLVLPCHLPPRWGRGVATIEGPILVVGRRTARSIRRCCHYRGTSLGRWTADRQVDPQMLPLSRDPSWSLRWS